MVLSRAVVAVCRRRAARRQAVILPDFLRLRAEGGFVGRKGNEHWEGARKLLVYGGMSLRQSDAGNGQP